jgi:hypothetical protein
MPSASGAYVVLNSSKPPFVDEQATFVLHFYSSSGSEGLKMLETGFLSIRRA